VDLSDAGEDQVAGARNDRGMRQLLTFSLGA